MTKIISENSMFANAEDEVDFLKNYLAAANEEIEFLRVKNKKLDCDIEKLEKTLSALKK